MSTTQDSNTATTAHPRRWAALGMLAVAQFMLILDITVVTVALPDLGADLAMGRAQLTWVLSAYTLAFGGLMLVAGRVADLFGPRPLLLGGLALFTVASLAVGLASSGPVAIGGRVAQGVGAAMLSPAALSMVVRLFNGDERNRALAIWSSLGGVGAAAGVLLGGVLTAGPGWQWAFFINVPVGTALLIALPRVLPPMPPWVHGGRVDVVGAALVSTATLIAIYAFIGAGERGWTSAATLGLIGAAATAYVGFVGWLTRAHEPLVDPQLLARRPVLAGTFVLFIATSLMVAVFFLGTFYLQQSAGHGPLATGLLFLPVALATTAGAQASGRLIGRTGARPLGVAGLIVAAAGLLVPAFGLSTATTVVAVSAGSAGLGALFVVAAATTLSHVAPEEAGIASGVLSTSHELGSSLGAAVVSGVAAAGLVAGSPAGFERGYLVAALVAAAAAAVAAVLIPGRKAS